jgi:hypothetical protein
VYAFHHEAKITVMSPISAKLSRELRFNLLVALLHRSLGLTFSRPAFKPAFVSSEWATCKQRLVPLIHLIRERVVTLYLSFMLHSAEAHPRTCRSNLQPGFVTHEYWSQVYGYLHSKASVRTHLDITWSGMWESNPQHLLGRKEFYH